MDDSSSREREYHPYRKGGLLLEVTTHVFKPSTLTKALQVADCFCRAYQSYFFIIDNLSGF